MTLKKTFVALTAALAAVSIDASAADESALAPTPAAKVDSGLGSLPPYAEWKHTWLYAIPAEKIDSGLGEMKDVSQIQEVWLYAQPAEKIDSGLGDLTAPQVQARGRDPR